ncbi:unnamed protein product [Didymodactylos carnosus]|uniref:Tetratricopeptide repeat protein n=1 Tax=Didymodactylos carnosus TaxID=1234261 RepID=A0A8S2G3Q5_9BILA|nr:unnamed protein product [Didymodactylos carnosus]CAF4432085.1 unnamed protein product [Didymodactylos carnosus]
MGGLTIFESYSPVGANVYYGTDDYLKTVYYYKLALDCERSDLSSVATTYRSLGDVYTKQFELNQALIQYEKALELQTMYFDPNHQHFTLLYNSFAMVYGCLNKYDIAEECIKKHNEYLMLQTTQYFSVQRAR